MVTVDALKLLYKKLGGTADIDNITAISDMVDLIEDVAGGGGASGMVVHVIGEEDEQYLDKTYAEIMGSIENGIMPVFSVTEGTGEGEVGYAVMPTSYEAGGIYGVRLLTYSSNNASWTPIDFMATSADGVLTTPK